MIALVALAWALPEHWRLEMSVASRAEIPVLGHTKATVRSVLDVRLTPTAHGWIQEQHVCSSQVLDGRNLVKTRLPPAFVAALPSVRFPVRITDGRYAADFGAQRVGWAGTGAIPADGTDTRVYDWDNDGKPGATVLIQAPIVGTGEVYVVQSGRTLVDGRLGADGVIRGGLTVLEFGSQVIGASSSFLLHGPKVSPDDAASWFTMTPVERGGC